ncbi:MAG: hypothetical protein K6G50_00850 [bacterium]|nr:hypothetical protein [bacterium]
MRTVNLYSGKIRNIFDNISDRWYFAAILYAVLLFIAIWPVGIYFNERFIGDFQGDMWKHAWGPWWVRSCLMSGSLPLFCRILNAPSGGYLFIADPFNCFTVGVLQGIMPLVMAYNLSVFLNVWGGCMASWALARYFTKSTAGSCAAGVIYGLSAYVLAYPVLSGVTETLNTAWIPLFVLFFHKTLDRGSISDVLGAAFFFFLTTVSCWYYGEFMVVYASVALFYRFYKAFFSGSRIHIRLRTWRNRQYSARQLWEHLIFALRKIAPSAIKTVIIMALGGIMIAPLAIMFKSVVSDPANIVMPDKAPKRSVFKFEDYLGSKSPWSVNSRGVQGYHNHTNLAGFFLPGKGNATTTITIDRLTRVHYLGWIAIFMAISVIRRRREFDPQERADINYWLGVFIFFLILSLGPRVVYSDFSSAGFISPLYLAMFMFFPMFHQVAIPFRFLTLSLLALGILCSFCLRNIVNSQPPWLKTCLAALIPGFMVLEVAMISPLPWPMSSCAADVPSVYKMLAEDKEDYYVIDYPFERLGSQLVPGEYFYYQTVHGHGIPYRTSGVLSSDVARSPFMEELRGAQAGSPDSEISRQRLREGAELLKAMGFKYLIIHEHLLPGNVLTEIQDHLLPVLGEPAYFGDGVHVFALDVLSEKDSKEILKRKAESNNSKDKINENGNKRELSSMNMSSEPGQN